MWASFRLSAMRISTINSWMLSSETCKNYFVFVTRRHAGAGTGCKRLRSLMFRKNHVCSGCSCDFSAALLIELLVAVLCFELIVVSNVFTFIASSVSMFSSPLLITPLRQNSGHLRSHAKFAQTVIPHLPFNARVTPARLCPYGSSSQRCTWRPSSWRVGFAASGSF